MDRHDSQKKFFAICVVCISIKIKLIALDYLEKNKEKMINYLTQPTVHYYEEEPNEYYDYNSEEGEEYYDDEENRYENLL